VKAKEAGLPSVFGHGMFSMGLLGRAITDWVGIGNLRNFKVRFTKQTWPGEKLTSKISVTGKRKEDGENLVDLDVTLTNESGEVKVAGSAVAALPSR
jgi:acyl dehydratase